LGACPISERGGNHQNTSQEAQIAPCPPEAEETMRRLYNSPNEKDRRRKAQKKLRLKQKTKSRTA